MSHDGEGLVRTKANDSIQLLATRLGLSHCGVASSVRALLDHLLERPAPQISGTEKVCDVLCRLAGQLETDFSAKLDERLTRFLRHLAYELGATEAYVADLEVVYGEERAALLAQGYAPTSRYECSKRIEQIVALHAKTRPLSIALVDHATAVSYADLVQHAEELALALRKVGLGKGDRVAIVMSRSVAQVISVLAVLNILGTYVPIDPELPAERIAFLLSDSEVRAALVHSNGVPLPDSFCGWAFSIDRSGCALPNSSPPAQENTDKHVEIIEDGNGSLAIAYIMYTSGTTGRPKGVPVPHLGVARLVLGCNFVKLDTSTVMLHACSIGFDATILETWGALLNGGTLCIADRDTLLDTNSFACLLRDFQVNTAVLTPALFSLHAERDPTVFKPMRQLMVGGDRFPVKLAQQVALACTELVFINIYGPTENACVCVAGEVTELDCDSVPLGRTVTNTVAWVMNRYGRLLPRCEVGELWVGGDGLGPGYLNRTEQSAKAFCPHPYVPALPLYRTGDLVSIDPSGQFWFHGRRDHQVKIRGQRIELGEVESTISRQPGVTAAVALVLNTEHDPVLHAFCTTTGLQSVANLIRALAKELPAAAVPSTLQFLDNLPVNTNGKVDRSALVELVRSSTAATSTKSINGVEDAIEFSALVAQALGWSPQDLNLSFAALGGSSIAAVRLARLIEDRLGVFCKPTDVLAAPSIAILHASIVDATSPIDWLGHSACQDQSIFVTNQQANFYVEQVKNPTSTAYNLPILIEFETAPDIPMLRRSLAELVARHPLLRARFAYEDDSVTMTIEPHLEDLPLSLHRIELSNPLNSALADFVRPFDLGQFPCWRAILLDGPRPLLLLDIHHILCDGHSLVLLLRDWNSLYFGELPAAPKHSFHDWLAWLTGPKAVAAQRRQLEAARAELAPLPAPPALPTDRARNGLRGWRGHHHVFTLGPSRVHAVEVCARELGVTPFHVLLGSYALWFARTTGSTDFVVGVPALGRAIRGSEEVVGPLVNTACVRLCLQSGHDVADYLRSVAADALTGLARQDVSVSELSQALVAQSDPRRHPLFDSLFAYQDGGLEGLSVLGGNARWLPEATRATLFDLNLQLEPSGDDLRATWAVSAELFDQSTLKAFCDAFVQALDAILAMPEAPLANLLDIPRVQMILPDIDFAF